MNPLSVLACASIDPFEHSFTVHSSAWELLKRPWKRWVAPPWQCRMVKTSGTLQLPYWTTASKRNHGEQNRAMHALRGPAATLAGRRFELHSVLPAVPLINQSYGFANLQSTQHLRKVCKIGGGTIIEFN